MNEDAEKWIAFRMNPSRLFTENDLREAMRWAYSDAGKICIDLHDLLGAPAYHCAQDIEARAK